LTPERWAQIEELFHRAAECDPEKRASLLDESCNGDYELRREVEVLLASEESAREDMHAAVNHGLEVATYPLVGETVSHYRILDGLGGGGMGLVYRAEDIKLGRQVALKFLPEDSAKDPAALARFEREARSASALEHPNICPIYEFGEHESQPFLVMQLLEGQTLRELISNAAPQNAPLPLDKLLDLAIQTASGLEAAHSHGIIHRDIKPANIYVTTQGQAKILDFGLAKLSLGDFEAEEPRQNSRNDTEERKETDVAATLATPDPFLSRPGMAMGTVGYMSPEQARGEKLDARTDLFSLGLVLYEMATGQRAFKGDTGPLLHDVILRSKPASARKLNPQVPAKLEAILRKALEKDRGKRYQSASELRIDLQSLKREVESKRSVRRWIPASAILVLIIVGAIFWSVRRLQTSSHALPQIKFRQLTLNSSENALTTSSISPNGKFLAYTDTQGVHVKDIETGSTHTVTVPKETSGQKIAWEIVDEGWFPDNGRFLVNSHPAVELQSAWSSRTSGIWIFSRTDEAPPRKLREHALGWSVSPDGTLISYGTNGERETWLVNAEGQQARKLLDTHEDSSLIGLLWFPDEHGVLYVRTDASGDTLWSRDLRTGASVAVLTPEETKSIRGDISLLPDGRLIYQTGPHTTEFSSAQDSCDFWNMRIDVHSGKVINKPTRLTSWTGFCIGNANSTKDGKQIAFLRAATLGTVYVADLEESGTRIRTMRHFTLDESISLLQDWTNDSRNVIFTSNRSGQFALYQQTLDEDQPRLISMAGLRDTPITPDSKWLFGFPFPRTGDPRSPEPLLRVASSGGAPESVTITNGGIVFCAKPSVSLCVLGERTEDRKFLTFSSVDPLKGRGRELARFDLDSNTEYFDFDISPDGSTLAAMGNSEGPLHLISLRGKPEQIIATKFQRAQEFHWAADGKGLYVPDQTERSTVLYYVDLRGDSHKLWENHGTGWIWARASPDGRHLAIESITYSNNAWMMENF
jgi:serine/threonine protein kinase